MHLSRPMSACTNLRNTHKSLAVFVSLPSRAAFAPLLICSYDRQQSTHRAESRALVATCAGTRLRQMHIKANALQTSPVHISQCVLLGASSRVASRRCSDIRECSSRLASAHVARHSMRIQCIQFTRVESRGGWPRDDKAESRGGADVMLCCADSTRPHVVHCTCLVSSYANAYAYAHAHAHAQCNTST